MFSGGHISLTIHVVGFHVGFLDPGRNTYAIQCQTSAVTQSKESLLAMCNLFTDEKGIEKP